MFAPLSYYAGFAEAANSLTSDERRAVYTTVAELMADPKSQGANLHRVDKARDKNLWSARVNRDIRIILHMKDGVMTLLYVDHHDAAYRWAESHLLKPQAMGRQPVLVRFKTEDVFQKAPDYSAQADVPKPFRNMSNDELRDAGLEPEQYDAVRAATDDTIFDLGLSETILERLLGVGQSASAHAEPAMVDEVTNAAPAFDSFRKELPPVAPPEVPVVSPAPKPEGEFGVLRNEVDLQAILSGHWEKWQVFLHPAQQELVDAHYNGPVRISGSAGTGKTIVALHRVNHLLRVADDTRVLLATISPALAGFLHARLRKLLADKPRLGERVEVCSVDDYAQRLYRVHVGEFQLATRGQVAEWINEACKATGDAKLKPLFLLNEWDDVVDAQQITSLEQYQGAERIGRKVRLSAERKTALWAVFGQIWAKLKDGGLMTQAGLYHRLNAVLEKLPASPIEHVVVDECQDLNQGQVRFLAVLTKGRPNALFLSGDIGQRIFQQPFSWRSQGIDLRGRTKTLRINYRTSQQIRKTADRLLEKSIVDADGERVDRDKTISAFGGAYPTVATFDSSEDEVTAVSRFLQERVSEGVKPHEMAIMVRDPGQLPRAEQAAKQAGLSTVILDQRLATLAGSINLSTMHLAKGLEFRAVAVMACDDDVIPSPSRLAGISDPGDMHQAYDLERHLLYVACTRARDHLMISGVTPASEFLSDLR